MFNMGGTEIIAVLVIALLVVRPKDLPVLARKAGKFLGTLRSYRDAFMKEMNSLESLKDLETPDKSDNNGSKEDKSVD